MSGRLGWFGLIAAITFGLNFLVVAEPHLERRRMANQVRYERWLDPAAREQRAPLRLEPMYLLLLVARLACLLAWQVENRNSTARVAAAALPQRRGREARRQWRRSGTMS